MARYAMKTEDRKVLKERLEQLSGQKPRYMGPPSFAYIFDGISLERDGTVATEADADMGIIETLISEGLVEGEAGTEPAESRTEETGVPAEPDAEAEDEADIGMETETEAEDNADTSVETEAEAEDDADISVETEAEAEDDTDTGMESDVEAEDDADTGIETETEAEDDDGTEPEENILKPEISFPTARHSGVSLRNILNTLYSQGHLISKATGGSFSVEEGLVEALREDKTVQSYETFAKTVAAYEEENGPAITGLAITPDKVSFTGFPEQGDPAKIRAYMELAAAISRSAIKHKRILARRNENENEKYYFHIWLTRIGLDGAEHKETRACLMENLSGHVAFRTPEDGERWKKRQAEKREALKAQKEAEETAQTEQTDAE